jgi:soluble lytic murein transglycosylase-like protein
MVKGSKKIFLNKKMLIEMLNLRRIGFSYNILANMFQVDRTSCAFQADRYGIKPEVVYDMKSIVSRFLPKPEAPKWKWVNGERFHL